MLCIYLFIINLIFTLLIHYIYLSNFILIKITTLHFLFTIYTIYSLHLFKE